MNWLRHFQAEFFTAWRTAALPDPQPSLDSYHRRRRYFRWAPAERVGNDLDGDPLHRDLLHSVYGFGALVGEGLAELWAAADLEVAKVADWCGRFNLGISLFDHVCDEQGRLKEALRLPPFHRFSGLPASPSPAPQPSLALLAEVAEGVLADLTEFSDDADGSLEVRGEDRAVALLAPLFQAQVATAEASLPEQPDLVRAEGWLAGKSAEPFAVMAEVAARVAGAPPAARTRAQRFGRALGTCFHLMDDASDLWEDRSNGCWNLFLLDVVVDEPALLRGPRDAFLDSRLGHHLVQGGLVEGGPARRRVEGAVAEYAAALADTPASPDMRRAVSGRMAAAFAAWL